MSIIDDLKPSTTHFNPVSGKPYPLQVANPHTNVDVIHSAVESTAGDAGISTLLYDFVPSDGSSITVEHVDDQTMQSFKMYQTEPHPSGQGVTFSATTQPYDYQFVTVPITNLTVGATVYVVANFYQINLPQPLTYTVQETGESITNDYGEQITFVATKTTHYLQLSADGVHDEFTIYNVSATTIDVSKDTCTPFLRTIKDGATTDTDLDGQPYTVVGEVRTSCNTVEEFTPVVGTVSVDNFPATQQVSGTVSIAPLEQPTHTPVSVTSGSYTLAAGVKSYSITFVNDGAISGAYRPAGYSTNADYVEQGYATALTVTGTSFIIEEVR